jgi:hypothetical protein
MVESTIQSTSSQVRRIVTFHNGSAAAVVEGANEALLDCMLYGVSSYVTLLLLRAKVG